jgi:hypothetical protein
MAAIFEEAPEFVDLAFVDETSPPERGAWRQGGWSNSGRYTARTPAPPDVALPRRRSAASTIRHRAGLTRRCPNCPPPVL